ncbi:sensor histidine kinase [Ottowia thiooxydans]|uniref:sensor histidine kinase n=1 Tax=Ottowia thiooxydans TaxID=219182 RepID=UPI0004043D8C|nr:ATP-binding protein [Ottowia thiooxydans]
MKRYESFGPTAIGGFLCWVIVSLGLVALCLFGPVRLWPQATGTRLGNDIPMQLLEDPGGRLTAAEVAALPNTAFEPLHGPLNKGYNHSTYWLRASALSLPGDSQDPLWLTVTPSYLDHVALFQPGDDATTWRARRSGDAVPMTERVRVRQLVFPLQEGKPLLLRVQTSSATHAYAVVWRSSELMAQLAAMEWASGAFLGISLLLALLLGGAALALRMRVITAMALFAAIGFLHGINVRGYAQLWLPEDLSRWANPLVSMGVFLLPASFAWLARQLLTRDSPWSLLDKVLQCLTVALLVGLLSVGGAWFTPLAAFAISTPWLVSILATWIGWSNMRRDGPSIPSLLVITPYAIYAVLGAYVSATTIGVLPSDVFTGIYWQFMVLLFNTTIAVAVGLRLVQRFRASVLRQAHLVKSLEQSEHSLEARVRHRTGELLHAQNALQAALESERASRLEQRQFFDMVNHEFRTPLTVIDSAATEQATFPSPDLPTQVGRATQIRRACRRLTALVENCLVSERLDAPSFGLRISKASIPTLVEDAAQLVRWSTRHRLRLMTDDAPSTWPCDPTLVHMALSNLVDNAVKYASAGEITVAARQSSHGQLEFSVSDEGPGMPPEVVQRIFDRFERGGRVDEARGFGLGLWVARRVARLHGGDVRVEPARGGGTCFTLVLQGTT